MKNNNAHLISYGSISTNFKIIAGLVKLCEKIKEGKIKQSRLDCYNIENDLPQLISSEIFSKIKTNELSPPKNMEVFSPSQYYPDHIDEGGISYFIALEKGFFTIHNVRYAITPFVLYSFEDSIPHNSDFTSIMLK